MCRSILFSMMASLMFSIPALAAAKPADAKASATKPAAVAPRAANLYAEIATDMDGKPAPLAKFAGKVALVVNTASRCGLTSQYEGLQKLQAKYEAKGFVVLGFPSNDFFGQEPGSNQEIKLFCEKNYQVSFPLFGKDHVKGDKKQPVYRYLTEGPQADFRGEISWNFEKFIVGRDGRIVARFNPRVKPEDPELISKLEQAISSP
jgi:glutathione peroxidase